VADRESVDPLEHDLELTVSALKDGPTDLGIAGGLIEIERWQERIGGSGAPALEDIGAALAELRGELESDAPDTAAVAALLLNLGRRTLAVGESLDQGATRRAVFELGNLLVREGETLPKAQ